MLYRFLLVLLPFFLGGWVAQPPLVLPIVRLNVLTQEPWFVVIESWNETVEPQAKLLGSLTVKFGADGSLTIW